MTLPCELWNNLSLEKKLHFLFKARHVPISIMNENSKSLFVETRDKT